MSEVHFLGIEVSQDAFVHLLMMKFFMGYRLASRILKGGDTIKIDMGVVLNGFYSDMATTILIDDGSDVSVENRAMMNANLSALMAGIAAARSNNTTREIASAIYDSLKSKGI